VLYEIIPVGVKSADIPSVDSLKYSSAASDSDEILTVKLRYKDPKSDVSKLLQTALAKRQATSFDNAGEDFRFASAVAAFAQKLNNSGDTGKMSIEDIINIAKKSKGADDDGSRADFIKLVNLYNSLPKPK
ncbi:MAG: DUF3520 domain-containing protein, partial [Elusimicrobium sp.]|jgi:Ca-activated chloride channel family protein|nr:DUF3520 domain-containing protein [Elusimicrobium sp.]